ncbi:MAG: HAD-IB family hydrolase [Armatimonadetes bacterium]|nr:HAD-IB family hydrolase [Armatimonadota bacterium]MDW8026925.1 HAD-IB family hydrolase [Armatimonadota bacterium]
MVAAFFDVDGTLTATNVLMPLNWFMKENLPRWRYWAWSLKLVFWLPVYFIADKIDRRIFIQIFFRQYSGIEAEKLRRWHKEHFERTLQRLVFAQSLERISWHNQQNHLIVLVTGSADFVTEPLASWLGADLIAAKLQEENGKFTGKLISEVLVGEGKAVAIKNYTLKKGVDLKASYAYGDSISDAPMLSLVGHPIAVNPDKRLRKLAIQKGWEIVDWR